MDDFYKSDVEFINIDALAPAQQPEHSTQRWLQAKASVMMAAVALTGLLTFYPSPASLTDLNVDPVAVTNAARSIPKHVPISDADRRAAAWLQESFTEVPPTVADRKISPDYGL